MTSIYLAATGDIRPLELLASPKVYSNLAELSHCMRTNDKLSWKGTSQKMSPEVSLEDEKDEMRQPRIERGAHRVLTGVMATMDFTTKPLALQVDSC
jgi:hypothetical protein